MTMSTLPLMAHDCPDAVGLERHCRAELFNGFNGFDSWRRPATGGRRAYALMTPRAQRLTGQGMLAILVLGLSLSAGAAQFTLGQLLGALASSRHGAATFTEKKYLSVLDQPVESSGELLFVPPARLEKRTLKPKVETLVLDGDVLTVERQMQKHVLQLKDYPEVAGMTESIRATLAGDRQALERVYRLGLEGSRDRWTLVLTPLDARVASVIDRIRMEGARDEVRKVEIFHADGDRSVMNVQSGAAK